VALRRLFQNDYFARRQLLRLVLLGSITFIARAANSAKPAHAGLRAGEQWFCGVENGAGEGIRTLDPNLGKIRLCDI
jgi:hypothetical protein